MLGWFSALGAGHGDGSLAVSGPVGQRFDGRAHVVIPGRPSRGTSAAGRSPAQALRWTVAWQVPQLIPGLPPLPPRRWPAPSKGTPQRQPDAPAVDCHVVKCVALTFD